MFGGTGVDKNLYTAKDWCQESYNNTNDEEIQRVMAEEIGNIYFLQDNFKDAKTWYTKAINTFSKKSDKAKFAHRIAEKYFDTKHYTTSAYWYKVAVDNGDKDDMFRLAYSLAERKRYKEAIKWYKKSNQYSKWNGTMGNLANVYIDTKEYKKAIYWFDKAVKNGNKNVYTNYGYAHDMVGNINQAIKWYKKGAIDNKNVDAMNNLGITYENKYDYKNAAYWYKKAIAAGHAKAKESLEKLYTNGYVSRY